MGDVYSPGDGFRRVSSQGSAAPVWPGDETDDAANNVPEYFLGRRTYGASAATRRIDPRNSGPPPPQASRPLGIFSGEPTPDYPVPPPIFGLPDDSRANGDDEQSWYTRRRRR